MTVRWKPLLILSGLFVMIGVLGLMAMAFALAPSKTEDMLAKARNDRDSKKYEEAKIHYLRALQRERTSGKIHGELAAMYADWSKTADPERRDELVTLSLASYAEAAKHDKTLVEPRKVLLGEALRQGQDLEADRWAKELIAIEPENPDANFVLATKALEEKTPNENRIEKHLAILEADVSRPVRSALVRALLAQVRGERERLNAILKEARGIKLSENSDLTDQMALLKLHVLDAEVPADLQADRVRAVATTAASIVERNRLSPVLISQFSGVLQSLRKRVIDAGAKSKRPEEIAKLGEELDSVIDRLFNQTTKDNKSNDPRLSERYADYLLARGEYQRCFQVVEGALKASTVNAPGFQSAVLGLHGTAVRAVLSDASDADRFQKAEPHIQALLASKVAYSVAIGHLFQGAIDLERMGVVEASGVKDGKGDPARHRASALSHLSFAAENLKELATAQALYGIALVLAGEPSMGRQYLMRASKLGDLEPRYQIWPAWSLLQAGYPEEAEPIARRLLDGSVKSGGGGGQMEAALHLLLAEIHQARRVDSELVKARAEYDKAIELGQKRTPSIVIRLAELDALQKHPEDAIKRLAELKKTAGDSPPLELMTARILHDVNKNDQARSVLDEAIKTYPDHFELVAFRAMLLSQAGEAEKAEREVAAYITRHPSDMGAIQLRVQLLADPLKKPAEARELLRAIVDKVDSSAPLIQLALLDLQSRDYKSMEMTIAKLRKRFKDLAATDLLEGQLALSRGNLRASARGFEEALQKDPGNKIAQFWLAQLKSRTGSSAEAAKSLEEILRSRTSKELESGIPLSAAAESALAAIQLETGDHASAVRRIKALINDQDLGERARPLRWQLVAAYVARKNWRLAKPELEKLVGDPKAPIAADERVRAAAFYQMNDELDAAQAQLDLARKQDPTLPALVTTQARLFVRREKFNLAVDALEKAIAAVKEAPPEYYLLLAAVQNLRDKSEKGAALALATLDRGLKAIPDSIPIIEAKYQYVREHDGVDKAIAVVESAVAGKTDPGLKMLLARVFRDEKRFDASEKVAREIVKADPADARPATFLVRVVADQAVDAMNRGDAKRARASDDEAARLIRGYRKQFPNDLSFVEAECELAARRGDMTKALEITREVDTKDASSPAGPLMRATIYSALGRDSETVEAYREAITRDPRRDDARLAMGQVEIKLGEYDDAVRQAEYVLQRDPEVDGAILLKARALAAPRGSVTETATNRAAAVRLLKDYIARNPGLGEAYRRLAEIQMTQKRRAEAIQTLSTGLAKNPSDPALIELLIRSLVDPRESGKPATPAEIDAAVRNAEGIAKADSGGGVRLALSLGFQRGGRPDLALKWAEEAAAKLGSPIADLNYANLLLTVGEATADRAAAEPFFRRAVSYFDRVLKVQANSVEAVNNKAWILHRYLGDDASALELAKGLADRLSPTLLPAEFFDTLGSIQQALNKNDLAVESFTEGLKRQPKNAMLNYHLGKLLASSPSTAIESERYLKAAWADQAKLPKPISDEVKSLLEQTAKANR